MNKVEFAVCRIKEKLPGNQGFATKGSGCVVHSESLTSSWGWKCHYFIVTPSVVLCREDLASNKVFLAEFLSKDKRGLETFEIKQMAEVCKDVVGRRLDSADLDLYLTFLSVEPLDKRGFLKRMVKKGSLQTYRPLESLESENKTIEELTEGLFCHVIVDLFSDQESTNSPFTTQTYKLVYDFQTREFSLQDFGGTLIHFNNEIPPIGAVVFTKKGEFAGLLRNFSSDWVTAIFLPQPFKEEDGERDVTALSTRDETSVEINGDVTSEITLKQEIQLESHSTKLVDDTTHAEGYSEDVFPQKNNNVSRPTDNDVERGNNNYPNSRDVIQNGGDDRGGRQDNSGVFVLKQFQECPENLIPGNRTENVETEMLLLSTDNTAEVKECEEKGGSGFFDETVNNNYSDAVEDIQKKAGDSGEKQVSCDGAGKASVETTVQEEGQVLVCKTAEGDDTTKSASDVPERFSDVEVDPCMEEEPLGHLDKQETSVLVHDGDPCSLENGSSAIEELPEESHGAVRAADCEGTMSDSNETATHGGGVEAVDESTSRESITGHDSSLITVIQVDGTSLPVETNKSKEQGELGDSETIVSEKVPSESKGVSTTKQPGISGEQSTTCFSDEDDRQITDLKKDTCIPTVNPGVTFEDTQVSANTKPEGASETYSAQVPGITVEASDIDNLVGTKPEDSCETDSTQMPGNIVDIEPGDIYNLISAKPEDATETDSSQMPCSTGDIEAGDVDNLVGAKPEDASETDPTQMPGSSAVDIEAGDIDNLVGAKPEDARETDPTQMPGSSAVDIEAGDIDNLVGAKPEDTSETDPTQMPAVSIVDIETGDVDNLVGAKPEDASETDPTQMPGSSAVDIEAGDIDNLVGAKPEDTSETDPTQMPGSIAVDIEAGDIDNLVGAKPEDTSETDPTQMPAGSIVDIETGDVDNLVGAKPEDASETDPTQMPGSSAVDIEAGDIDNLVGAKPEDTSEKDPTQMSAGSIVDIETVDVDNLVGAKPENTRETDPTQMPAGSIVDIKAGDIDNLVSAKPGDSNIRDIGSGDVDNLVIAKPEDASETDSTQMPGSTNIAMCIETSEQVSGGLELVTQGNQEFTRISEVTVNTSHDSLNVSVCNTSAIEDITEIGLKDDGNLKEDICSRESVLENTNGKGSLIDTSQIIERNGSGQPLHENEVEDVADTDDHNLKGDNQGCDDVVTNLHEKDNSIDISQTAESNSFGELNGQLGEPCVVENDVRTHEDWIDSEGENNVENVSGETKNVSEQSELASIMEQCSQKLNSIQTREDNEKVLMHEEVNNKVTEHESDITETTGVSEEYADKERISFKKTSTEYNDNHANKEFLEDSSPSEDTVAVQRVDADALLSETITNSPHILRDLGSCLDTEYQYGKVPCWRDLAELLAISPEDYEDCTTFSLTSPTEDLFVFLSATKPQLTIQEIKEALKEIDRLDVAHLLDRKIAGGLIREESILGNLVERDGTGILGRMAMKLDRTKTNNWKDLALQLCVPPRVLRNFGSHQGHNPALMLFKYIPIFDPDVTLDHLKGCLTSIERQDAVAVLEKASIPGDEPVKDILDDSDLLDRITDMLNDDSTHHWRHLARALKIPPEKCKIFEPTEDNNSPTKLLFKSIEKCEPDLTFEELVLALVAMKRQDVLDVLQKYFSSDDIDQILEENNLLTPAEDPLVDQKEV